MRLFPYAGLVTAAAVPAAADGGPACRRGTGRPGRVRRLVPHRRGHHPGVQRSATTARRHRQRPGHTDLRRGLRAGSSTRVPPAAVTGSGSASCTTTAR
ncbi:hypothetical protein ACRAWF_17240 [Streptomyces sp. L7]